MARHPTASRSKLNGSNGLTVFPDALLDKLIDEAIHRPEKLAPKRSGVNLTPAGVTTSAPAGAPAPVADAPAGVTTPATGAP